MDSETITIVLFTEHENYLVRPEHIPVDWDCRSSFGKHEPETAARYIVKLCQQSGGWKPFTYSEIQAIYQQDSSVEKGDKFDFRGLERPLPRWELESGTRGGWIVKLGDKYYISQLFVDNIWESAQKYHPSFKSA